VIDNVHYDIVGKSPIMGTLEHCVSVCNKTHGCVAFTREVAALADEAAPCWLKKWGLLDAFSSSSEFGTSSLVYRPSEQTYVVSCEEYEGCWQAVVIDTGTFLKHFSNPLSSNPV
jgi:hypothetical protein